MNQYSISPVLIVKNEEALLERCLKSVQGLDEIIICDTGSTDKTIEIAKKYTDKVYTDFTWNDNFAQARNHAKSKATSDWILSLDADEWLEDVSKVRNAVILAEERHALAVDVECIAEDNGQSFMYPRLFKNSPQVFWEGAIHNTVSVLGEKLGKVIINIGYSPAHHNDPDRAFRILKKEVNEKFHPRAMFYLGREYFYRRDYENCVITLGKYVQVSNFLAEKAEAFLVMARSYWSLSMPNDCRDALAQALIINANFSEALYFMAEIAGEGSGNERWEKNARQWRKMAESADNSDVLFVRKREEG